MVSSGEVPQIIFAMISRRIKLMLIIKDLKNQGMSPEPLANKIGEHPYPVKRIYKYVDKYSFTELENMLDMFLQADVKVKTGDDKAEDAILNTLIGI
jgi:DNA polymerase-3 subunit delta